MFIRPFLTLVVAAHLCGCAVVTAERWPDAGTGGFAEWLPAVETGLEGLQMRVDALRVRGAPRFAGADFEEVETMLARVRREALGGLDLDAEADLARVEQIVGSIEARLSRPARQPARRVRS